MKKFLIAGMALAMLAIPAAASADVARCEASVPTDRHDRDVHGQPARRHGPTSSDNVWTHDFTVTVNPCDGTFTGAGPTYRTTAARFAHGPRTITGSFNADGTDQLRHRARRSAARRSTVTDAPMTTPTVDVESRRGRPTSIEIDDLDSGVHRRHDDPGTESVKNHGQYVKAQGGGKIAAQACAGMPLNSTQRQVVRSI